ncbi:hypothetical protein ACJJI3_01885 [Microbulbifer sp. ZKSA004]|uniref:hypothetical protein n=1 Tax=Microbulbifer sp. ZKSA004 TaxID=3243389 RepID=UPI00403A5C62
MSNILKLFMAYLTLVSGAVMAESSNWNESNVKIGRQSFHIKLPPNESKDFPTTESLQFVNLTDERLDVGAQSITAIKKYWDFSGGLLQGVQGALNIKVRVRKVPSSFEGSIFNDADLEMLLMERISNSGVDLPSQCVYETINGAKWLSYKLTGNLNSTDYVFPLTENIYIQVQADFITNSKEINPKWLNKAQKMLVDIASSMVVVKND